MRFIKSSRGPICLKFTKKKVSSPFQTFILQCQKISEKLKILREKIDSHTFPTQEIKELIDSLVNLKKIDIPSVKIPFTVLQTLEKQSLNDFLTEAENRNINNENLKKARVQREKEFYEELCKLDLEIK